MRALLPLPLPKLPTHAISPAEPEICDRVRQRTRAVMELSLAYLARFRRRAGSPPHRQLEKRRRFGDPWAIPSRGTLPTACVFAQQSGALDISLDLSP